MGHREYNDLLLNDITYFFQIFATAAAYLFNIILIFIVQKHSNKEIGTYRILITYFALSDLYYNTAHFIVYPIPENYGNSFIMRGYGYYQDLIGTAMYMGAYGHAFPILIFHFLYRLFAIRYPKYLAYFPAFLFALVMSTAAINALWFSVFYWFFHPDEEIVAALTPIFNGTIPLPILHTIENVDKHSMALYWTNGTFSGPRWSNLIGVFLMCSSMTTTYSLIVICSYKISVYLKERSKSEQSIRLHKQLFRSLMYQAFVPVLTAYYPAGSTVVFPVFGFSNYYASIVVPPACATHPLFDPLLLIFTINDYRRAFLDLTGISMMRRAVIPPKPKVPTITDFTRTSSVAPQDLIII